MRNWRSFKDRKDGASAIIIVIVALIVIVLMVAVAAYALTNGTGDNKDVYIPPDPTTTTILGYVSASVTVLLDNSQSLSSLVIKFQSSSLKATLQSEQTSGLDLFHGFDIWSHSKGGYVMFQITNPVYSYDTGKMKASFTGNVGGTSIAPILVNLPNGPAIKHHGTYQVSVFLFDDASSLQDTQSINVEL